MHECGAMKGNVLHHVGTIYCTIVYLLCVSDAALAQVTMPKKMSADHTTLLALMSGVDSQVRPPRPFTALPT